MRNAIGTAALATLGAIIATAMLASGGMERQPAGQWIATDAHFELLDAEGKLYATLALYEGAPVLTLFEMGGEARFLLNAELGHDPHFVPIPSPTELRAADQPKLDLLARLKRDLGTPPLPRDSGISPDAAIVLGPLSERKVTATCPLCGKSWQTTWTVPEGVTSVSLYCDEKQCQWTKRLEEEHPDWSREICLLIGERKIQIGMTKEQAEQAWGTPYRINRSTYASGVHEQWVYRIGFLRPYDYHYVYLRNGIVTAIQK